MEKNLKFSIPVRSLLYVLGLICFGIFTYIQMIGYILPSFKEIWLLKSETATIYDIDLVWTPVISNILIYINFYLLLNIFYKLNLNKDDEVIKDIIGSLILSLFFALAWAIISVNFYGFILGFFVGSISGSVLSLRDDIINKK